MHINLYIDNMSMYMLAYIDNMYTYIHEYTISNIAYHWNSDTRHITIKQVGYQP